MQIVGAARQFVELSENANYSLLFASMQGEDSAYFTVDLSARNGTWNEVIDIRRVGSQLKARWALFQAEHYQTSPTKKILDLADEGFPAEYRYAVIHPIETLAIPDISQQRTHIPDVIPNPTKFLLFASTANDGSKNANASLAFLDPAPKLVPRIQPGHAGGFWPLRSTHTLLMFRTQRRSTTRTILDAVMKSPLFGGVDHLACIRFKSFFQAAINLLSRSGCWMSILAAAWRSWNIRSFPYHLYLSFAICSMHNNGPLPRLTS